VDVSQVKEYGSGMQRVFLQHPCYSLVSIYGRMESAALELENEFGCVRSSNFAALLEQFAENTETTDRKELQRGI